jgi:membrane protein YdbS with pleckstrin-like domain
MVCRAVLLGAAYAIADVAFGSRWETSVFHPFVGAGVAGACAVGAVVGLVHAGRHVRSWRYRIDDDALVIEWGVFWWRRASVLRHRVVTFEVSAGPVRRKSGLWKLQLRTGNSPEQLVIPGLDAGAVDELATALGFGGTIAAELPA